MLVLRMFRGICFRQMFIGLNLFVLDGINLVISSGGAPASIRALGVTVARSSLLIQLDEGITGSKSWDVADVFSIRGGGFSHLNFG